MLIERKNKVVTIYDGYIFQLYAQYFSLIEMGYSVKTLQVYSLSTNKKYAIPLPYENLDMLNKFEETINSIKTFKIDSFVPSNYKKCINCIYEPACDRSITC